MENVLKLERPRTIKTHLSYDMLPKQISQKGAKVHNIHYLMFEVMNIKYKMWNLQFVWFGLFRIHLCLSRLIGTSNRMALRAIWEK